MSDLTQNNWNRFQQARVDREKYPVQEKDMQPEVRQYALEGQMDDEERKREMFAFLDALDKHIFKSRLRHRNHRAKRTKPDSDA